MALNKPWGLRIKYLASPMAAWCLRTENSKACRNIVAILQIPTQTMYAGKRRRVNCVEAKVKSKNLKMMSVDELWNLHEEISPILSAKLDAEKRELERRIARLKGPIERRIKSRRPYPKVHPKYRNPDRPSETWSGRGKQPRWVGTQLKSGKKVDDLLISRMH